MDLPQSQWIAHFNECYAEFPFFNGTHSASFARFEDFENVLMHGFVVWTFLRFINTSLDRALMCTCVQFMAFPGFDLACLWPSLLVSGQVNAAVFSPWPHVSSVCLLTFLCLWQFGISLLQCHLLREIRYLISVSVTSLIRWLNNPLPVHVLLCVCSFWFVCPAAGLYVIFGWSKMFCMVYSSLCETSLSNFN